MAKTFYVLLMPGHKKSPEIFSNIGQAEARMLWIEKEYVNKNIKFDLLKVKETELFPSTSSPLNYAKSNP